MKISGKQIISMTVSAVLLSACLLLLFALPAAAQTTSGGSQGLAFGRNADHAYTLTGIGTCTDTRIVIPATVDGMPVTAISGLHSDRITSVVIPDTVQYIGRYAFSMYKPLGCRGWRRNQEHVFFRECV